MINARRQRHSTKRKMNTLKIMINTVEWVGVLIVFRFIKSKTKKNTKICCKIGCDSQVCNATPWCTLEAILLRHSIPLTRLERAPILILINFKWCCSTQWRIQFSFFWLWHFERYETKTSTFKFCNHKTLLHFGFFTFVFSLRSLTSVYVHFVVWLIIFVYREITNYCNRITNDKKKSTD